MIAINLMYNDSEKIVGFEVKGHALGQARVDKYDLICCAVSILTLTTVNGITDYVQFDPEVITVEDGYLKMMLPVDLSGELQIADCRKSDQIEALLGSMVLGLQELAQDHPKYVQFNKRRWTSHD